MNGVLKTDATITWTRKPRTRFSRQKKKTHPVALAHAAEGPQSAEGVGVLPTPRHTVVDLAAGLQLFISIRPRPERDEREKTEKKINEQKGKKHTHNERTNERGEKRKKKNQNQDEKTKIPK